jgi:alpha-mannosidase
MPNVIGDSSLGVVTAQLQAAVERFESQARFAAALCELHPAGAEAWRPLLAAARALVGRAVSRGDLEGVRGAVAEAEALLAPLGPTAKRYTIHCVGHAHIDMNWMWSWPETVAVTNDTFLTVLRLMDEFPDFRFSQSQASVYAILERHNPDLLARIAQRVAEGRWEVTASHWVEGDKNLAGGESLARHLLYTREYIQGLFGLAPEDVPIDWAPDTFGHAATIPTYLVRGGVKYVYMHRPGIHGPKKPDAFWWEGPDGARVLVRNDMKYGYNQQLTPALMDNLVGFAKEFGAQDFISVYGVGDHGGGPTRRDLLRGLEMASWPIFPTIRPSTARDFFQALETLGDKLPTLKCELNTEFTGCYTTQSLVKKVCRVGETRLMDAEAAATLAWGAAGFPYPAAILREGWQDILFNHFHDILPGSGVHDTRTYTHGLYQKTVAATSQVEAQALRRLAARVDTSYAGAGAPSPLPPAGITNSLGAGVGFRSADGALCQSDQSAGDGPRPFLLFNPTASDRQEVLEATIWDTSQWHAPRPLRERAFQIRYPDGTALPAQVCGGGGFWGHDHAILALPAQVPGLGYASCVIEEVEQASLPPAAKGAWQIAAQHHCAYSMVERGPEGIENALLRLELDPATGGIKRLVDKGSGRTLVVDAPLLEYAVERPHGMTAWCIDHTGPVDFPQVTKIERQGDGPHKAAINVKATVKASDFTVRYELRAGDPRLYVSIIGVWFERGTPQTGIPVLTFALPLTVADAAARYEIPFGAVDRDLNNGMEVPALQWAQVTGTLEGETAGCLLINDTKHGYALDGSTLRLTLIRSSYDPDILPEIGQHEIHLAVQPFAGALPLAEAIAAGNAFNHPVRVVSTDVHAGTLPAEACALSAVPGTIILSAVKKAEAGEALVIRLFETAGEATRATLTLTPALLGQIVGAQEVDLLERLVENSTALVDGETVTVTVPAYGIASVKVTLG